MEQSQHEEIQRSLGRIEGHQSEIIKRLDKINGRLEDHAEQIGKLKTWQTTIKTQVGILAAGASLGIAFVFKFINDRWG